jgi:hypothetical protein
MSDRSPYACGYEVFEDGTAKPRPVPEAVRSLADPDRREDAKAAWEAASRLSRLIDQWEGWLTHLKTTGDADAGFAIGLRWAVRTCVETLRALEFSEGPEQEILELSPDPPVGDLSRPWRTRLTGGTAAEAQPEAGAGGRYTARTHNRAGRYGCARAGVPPWHPNQPRHAAATRVRRAYDLDATRAVLGDSDLKASEVYAEQGRERAARVMEENGWDGGRPARSSRYINFSCCQRTERPAGAATGSDVPARPGLAGERGCHDSLRGRGPGRWHAA